MPPETQEAALILIDRIEDAAELADLVMANLPASVADMAAYAEEPRLPERLEQAIAALEADLAKAQAATGQSN